MSDKSLTQIRAERQAEIERAAGARLEQQRQADEAARQRATDEQATWRARRAAELDRQREEREERESRQLADELRRRYIAAGGTRDDFEANRDALIRRHLEDVTLGHAAPVAGNDFSDPARWGLRR